MRAVELDGYGSTAQLRVAEVPVPELKRGQVLLEVRACGINYQDVDLRLGRSRRHLRFPHVLGREVAGVVAEAGDSGYGVGDRVMVRYETPCGACEQCHRDMEQLCPNAALIGVNVPGGYAEFVAVPAAAVVPLPSSVEFADAAATQISHTTALHALLERGELKAGECVGITGATGGVGGAAIQVARDVGATVVAIVGSREKLPLAIDGGADVVLVIEDGKLAAQLRHAGLAVDLILDTVGGAVFQECVGMIRPGGRVVVCGAHAGESVELDLVALYRSEVSVIGTARARTADFNTLLDQLTRRRFHHIRTAIVGLDDVPVIHNMMENRELLGKAVIDPTLRTIDPNSAGNWPASSEGTREY